MAALFSIGVDVGGTNTDAVVLQGDRVVSWSKQVTTPDVTTGVARAVRAVLAQVKDKNLQGTITRVNIGTTHFVNALVQRRDLVPVSVVRLCGTASRALPPFCDFPQDLKKSTGLCDVQKLGGEEQGASLWPKHFGTAALPPPPASPAGHLPTLQETEPQIHPETGEWVLSPWDVECLAVGAGILGCGGGGSPELGRQQALRALEQGRKIRVIAPERLDMTPALTGTVATVAFMGAPTIQLEKLCSGTETRDALRCVQDLYAAGYNNGQLSNKDGLEVKRGDGVTYLDDYRPAQTDTQTDADQGVRVVAVMSAEIGGLNSMEPLVVGAALDLPVVDADGMGRAFPELQMFGPFICGVDPCPAALSDDKGQRAAVLQVDSAKHLENHFRTVCVNMGCSAGVAFAPLTAAQVRSSCIQYSLSRAWRLGHAVLHAYKNGISPIQAVLQQENGRLLATGKPLDVL
ncbi:uncharacterized protein LOC118422924 [Branchiostoma floridae]|uniref:Uncharacterized protein LOC118422924 n=1 Tax=Branchiostoma floridae TaxID=7739 RepID=A0A9J7LQC7_BRAFL|nr:uncharacterized protein LOC118422924 [Branchiostoma floridae]